MKLKFISQDIFPNLINGYRSIRIGFRSNGKKDKNFVCIIELMLMMAQSGMKLEL